LVYEAGQEARQPAAEISEYAWGGSTLSPSFVILHYKIGLGSARFLPAVAARAVVAERVARSYHHTRIMLV
jgi:hypothetical protein